MKSCVYCTAMGNLMQILNINVCLLFLITYVVGLITLVRLKINSQDIISERASAKIRGTIVRMGLFSLLMFVFVMVTFVCHMYEFHHHDEWKDSFRKFIM